MATVLGKCHPALLTERKGRFRRALAQALVLSAPLSVADSLATGAAMRPCSEGRLSVRRWMRLEARWAAFVAGWHSAIPDARNEHRSRLDAFGNTLDETLAANEAPAGQPSGSRASRFRSTLALVNSDQLVTPHSETTWPRSISRRNSGRAMISSIVRGLSRRFNAELLKVTMEGLSRVSSLLGRRH